MTYKSELCLSANSDKMKTPGKWANTVGGKLFFEKVKVCRFCLASGEWAPTPKLRTARKVGMDENKGWTFCMANFLMWQLMTCSNEQRVPEKDDDITLKGSLWWQILCMSNTITEVWQRHYKAQLEIFGGRWEERAALFVSFRAVNCSETKPEVNVNAGLALSYTRSTSSGLRGWQGELQDKLCLLQ